MFEGEKFKRSEEIVKFTLLQLRFWAPVRRARQRLALPSSSGEPVGAW